MLTWKAIQYEHLYKHTFSDQMTVCPILRYKNKGDAWYQP